ncbi:DedA family protein [Candidatus Dependentiae bacterium]|nr:DedA family protein [Candidatus Dependentiae bacterium]
MFQRTYTWMCSKVNSKYASLALGILFYLEAICFLPTDPMLIFYCIEKREYSLWFATIATIGSVFGGITSYMIGFFLWYQLGYQIIHNWLVNKMISADSFVFLCSQYKKYEYWAILVAGFTPIPYKAATLTAGFCKLSFIPFVLCSAIARGTRFFLIAIIMKKWGHHMKKTIDRYLHWVVIAILSAIILFLICWFYW